VSPLGLFLPGEGIAGPNVINYSVTSGPCVAYAQTTITVEQFVSADMVSYVNPMCRNANSFNLNSHALNSGGVWSGSGVSGVMFYPTLANAGVNHVLYTIRSQPLQLCQDTTLLSVQVNDIPNVTVSSNDHEGCAPLEVLLNINNANVGKGYWDMGDGSQTKEGLSTSYVFNHPGTYTVTYTYQDEIGCETHGSLTRDIKVFDQPAVDFSAPSEVLISNPVFSLTNLSPNLNKNTYVWEVGDKVLMTSAVNPTVNLEEIGVTRLGRHAITLAAKSKDGCTNEITRYLELKNDFNIYIPSSFTPNGDALNDIFKPVFSPYGLDEKTYEMEIFDRWGHSLFYTKDVNKGWDGSVLNKGEEELKEEVYIYRIKYKDSEGNVYNKMGHVSLLR
jgi:gliding motility-associated-like protein